MYQFTRLCLYYCLCAIDCNSVASFREANTYGLIWKQFSKEGNNHNLPLVTALGRCSFLMETSCRRGLKLSNFFRVQGLLLWHCLTASWKRGQAWRVNHNSLNVWRSRFHAVIVLVCFLMLYLINARRTWADLQCKLILANPFAIWRARTKKS